MIRHHSWFTSGGMGVGKGLCVYLKMFKTLALVGILFGQFESNVGQILQVGQCNQGLQVQADFNIENFLGPWYEIAQTPDRLQDRDCSLIEFSSTTESDLYAVFNSFVSKNFASDIYGTASSDVNENAAKLNLNLTSINEVIDYWVLYTDYNTFALTYSCQNIDSVTRSVNLWKLSRRPFVSDSVNQQIDERIFSLLGINASENMIDVDHSDQACYKLPVIEAGQPIILPGYCNDNLAAVQNFDATQFTGRWHQISSYFTPNSVGDCVEANYGLNVDGTVSVLNSQVINQTLLTISGVAVVASNDGSGVLNVRLEVAPNVFAESELKILATDYNNYAISYTCVYQEHPLTGSPERQVFSWILSKNRELSASSAAAISEFIDTIIDLNDNYYLQTDQSDAACFYYPEVEEGQPVVLPGSCSSVDIQGIPNFNAVEFTGRWHQISSYYTPNSVGDCVEANYGVNVDGTVSVLNSQVINQTLLTISGVAVVASNDGSGVLNVRLEVAPNVFVESELKILATDYNNYAVSYTCVDQQNPTTGSPERQVISWILSRSKSLSASSATSVSEVIDTTIDLNENYYLQTDQSDVACFYYPEVEEGQTVVLTGSCNSVDIKGIPNFDAAEFTGRWHQISSYFTPNSVGDCIEANYGLNVDGTVSVLNSQVINQTLLTISGYAVVASNDGSGVLNVRLEVAPNVFVESELKILATDYNNYAVSYTCVDQQNPTTGSPERQVFSWILSRTRSLSPSSATSVSEVIDTIIDLKDNYYLQTDQSDDACFYYSEVEEGQSVVFPGSCNSVDIKGIPNFNVLQFTGRWHQISSYFTPNSIGDCVEANYGFNLDGTVSVLNSQVINQTLLTISGVVVVASNDGSGVLNVRLEVAPNVFVESELKILATDYNNYAVSYTCVDQQNPTTGSPERQVISWILSRSKSLSASSATSVSEVIDTIIDLNENYYLPTDQSDAACFYYPEVEEGQVVVLPGSCSSVDIKGIPNFNAVEFTGRWHQISSYFTANSVGDCVEANYGLNVDGTVSVLNSQVIDQTLLTISGVAVVASNDGSGVLNVRLEVAPNVFAESELKILATDYNNYAVSYTCVDQQSPTTGSAERQVFSWILSRTRSLSPSSATSVSEVIDTIIDLNDNYYLQTDQSDAACFYYPEVEEGQPVVLPGSCSSVDIQGIPNFNAVEFTGRWHQISSYFTPNSVGDCVEANYGLNVDGTVSVLNSQVINQTLLTISGVAVVASNDNSGVLNVILEVAPNVFVESELKILATDYNNYAVSYTCVDQQNPTTGSPERQVFSWILSRSKSLSASTATSVSEVIDTIIDLNENYYLQTDQSDGACFYYPEVEEGQVVVLPGSCSSVDIKGIPNFNAVEFTGRWHQISSYFTPNSVGDCVEANYGLNVDGTVSVLNSQVINQTLLTISGVAVVASNDGSGVLNVRLEVAPTVFVESELKVLATDYNNYAVSYTCIDQQSTTGSPERQVFSWILSRTRSLSPSSATSVSEVIDTIIDLNDNYYLQTDQSDAACFYYPEIEEGQPVVLPGSCETAGISGVPNFNVEAYLGYWYELARYPQEFEDGECARATYSLDGDAVGVFNEIVSNQTLNTINGYAVVASSDNSGFLYVTFVIDDLFEVTSNYYVLGTDYDNYALVYSCTNVDQNRRRVSSWKLSRSKSLDAQYVAVMDNIIDNTQGLLEAYYRPTSQTDEDCFYVPEVNSEEEVRIRGQCGNVNGIQGFNAERFRGWWHEIESYSTGTNVGECISSNIQSSGNQYLAVDTNVFGLGSEVTSSTLEISNDGRLTRALSNGDTSTIWVLATDYDNYALLYSCEQVNDEYVRVWSAKHSKTRELSQASVNAMAPVIEANQFLYNHLYLPVNQSDEACFHYPELNGPVILNGKCDEDIPVELDFDVVRYTGTWYQIEKYDQPFERGTCAAARYTLSEEEGVVDVLNYQVVDGELEEIEGTATVASTDGSAKLNVNLLVGGEVLSTSLYVLKTDYISYSLVYSCRNINDFQRALGVWKLSRTRTMPSSANNIINDLIDQRPELHHPYFMPMEQDENCLQPSSAGLLSSSLIVVIATLLLIKLF